MSVYIIWFVALDWIVFGALHFLGHDQALLQMPDWIPSAWRSPLVYASGALEVVSGIMILMGGSARHWGAVLSLVILIGISPAIVHIALSAQPFLQNAVLNQAFRWIVIPHGLLIAWLSVLILRS